MKSLKKYRGLLLAFAVVAAFALIMKLRSNAMTSSTTADTTGLSAPASAGQDSVTVYVQPAVAAASSAAGQTPPPAAPYSQNGGGGWLAALSSYGGTLGAQFQRGLQFGPRPGGVISPAPHPPGAGPFPQRRRIGPLLPKPPGPAPAPGIGSAAAVVAPLSASSQTATDAATVQANGADPFGTFLQELKISGLPISLN